MRAAVIDVGSNTIKLLVAERGDPGIREVLSRTLDVRISRGIGGAHPSLGADAMDQGAAAVAALAAEARSLGADRLTAVATSAVRDAANGAAFRERVRTETGVELRILSGGEEAALIGRGLTTDPALAALTDFNVYDLGGGSLECLSFVNREPVRAVSLQLGCVRLTEKFVADAAAAFTDADARRVREHVEAALGGAGFGDALPAGTAVIGCGGTVTTARAILAAEVSATLSKSASRIEVGALRRICAKVAPMPLALRRQLPGLSAARADVYPAALVTLIAIAERGRFEAFLHSFRNLRWGMAASLLD